MFVLKKEATYSWPISVDLPVDGGRYKKETFTAVFKRIEASKLQEMLMAEGAKDADLCRLALVGWKDVKDELGADVEFSPAAFTDMLEIPGVAVAIAKTYLESVAGAKAKN